jgi:hypothetical protein
MGQSKVDIQRSWQHRVQYVLDTTIGKQSTIVAFTPMESAPITTKALYWVLFLMQKSLKIPEG